VEGIAKMKNKRFMSILLVYVFFLTVIPFNFLSQTVKAASIDDKNLNSLQYYILATAMYKDMAILYTNIGVIKVTPTGSEVIGKPSEISSAYNLGRINDDLFFSTSTYDSVINRDVDRKLVKVNINSGEKTTTAFSLGDNTYNYHQYLDKKGFVWFPVKNYGNSANTNTYSIMRIDSKNVDNKKQVEVMEDITYSNIGGSDESGNIWLIGGKFNYKLIRASYDDKQDKIVTKTFSIENQVAAPNNIYIDKENNVWCHDYSTESLKQLAFADDNSVQVVKEIKLPKNSDRIRTDLNKDIWVITQNFRSENGSTYLNKLEGDKFISKHILNTNNYLNISFADEKNILFTNWENGICYYLLLSNGKAVYNDENIEKVKQANYLIEKAKSSLAFVDYNYAYDAIMDLSGDDQGKLLYDLSAIWEKVYTPDIAKVLNLMNTLIKEKDLTSYYDLKSIIETEVKQERNRDYLLSELDSFGKESVFTKEVVNATDAIIKAWNKKDAASISEAEAAISKVKVNGSVKWLNEQLEALKK
jgi:hypothetical protein